MCQVYRFHLVSLVGLQLQVFFSVPLCLRFVFSLCSSPPPRQPLLPLSTWVFSILRQWIKWYHSYTSPPHYPPSYGHNPLYPYPQLIHQVEQLSNKDRTVTCYWPYSMLLSILHQAHLNFKKLHISHFGCEFWFMYFSIGSKYVVMWDALVGPIDLHSL